MLHTLIPLPLEKYPAVHEIHTPAAFAPLSEEYLPGSHDTHASDIADLPVEPPYDPGAQSVHTVFPAMLVYDPVAHWSQGAELDAPGKVENFPAPHPVQMDSVVAPVPVQNVPAVQRVHAVHPMDRQNFPDGHWVHAIEPGPVVYSPG